MLIVKFSLFRNTKISGFNPSPKSGTRGAAKYPHQPKPGTESSKVLTKWTTLVGIQNRFFSKIREVPVGALNFAQLTSLSLEFNGITVIIPQAFQNVPHLQYLYLTGNKFPSWQPEMFRFINELRTLGIGETPISVIPANAFVVNCYSYPLSTHHQINSFQHTPNLMRLEMSEAGRGV